MSKVPQKILIATRNQGKVDEIRAMMSGFPTVFLSLADVKEAPEVTEDGDTFEENAIKKARTIAESTGIVSLADDSGLCIDALDGRPGVRSARYAGENASDAEKCTVILEEMHGVREALRTARFVCVLALAWPYAETELFRGVCEGMITAEPRGKAGFGYDPIFYYPEAGCTFAEMDRGAKNRVSHRGRALRQLAKYLWALES
jgi:XTP/dITP diphosphohydrolase